MIDYEQILKKYCGDNTELYTQGVEAQTLANVYLAIENNHEIVPALNKVDLPSADVERVKGQIEDVIGIDASGAVETSGKTGLGVEELLEAIVENLPAPTGDVTKPLKALLIDSWYDAYLGVIILVRVVDGELKKKQIIRSKKRRILSVRRF